MTPSRAESDGLALRPWTEGDRNVLTLSNRPEMMEHLGGPETEQKLDERHQRYVRVEADGIGHMFVITTAEHPEGVGGIGYWNTDHDGEPELEAGWNVHLEFQGRGYAVAAVRQVLAHAAANSDRRILRAVPFESNAASNAVCERAGFTFVRTFDDEYPPGNPCVANEWMFDLATLRG
jgi:RimJ/RimL family protein N-acetyltransferase